MISGKCDEAEEMKMIEWKIKRKESEQSSINIIKYLNADFKEDLNIRNEGADVVGGSGKREGR